MNTNFTVSVNKGSYEYQCYIVGEEGFIWTPMLLCRSINVHMNTNITVSMN